MRKGSSFEREICKQLSLWWTYGIRDDVFWRTSGSGARAKTRSKTGKETFGQYGDIQATDPIGQKLIDVCSIELKRGYNKSTFADLIDKPDKAAEQMFEKFIYQAEIDAINANVCSWLLIVKRDRRKALIFMPFAFKRILNTISCPINKKYPLLMFSFQTNKHLIYKIFGMPLDKFLKAVLPSHIKKLYDNKLKFFPSVINSKKKRTEKIGKVDFNKQDQVFKCTSCDENEVVWLSGAKEWKCQNCGVVNDYPK